MKRNRWNPGKAHAQQNCEAWWYADPGQGSITVAIRAGSGPTFTCQIKKRSLRAALAKALWR